MGYIEDYEKGIEEINETTERKFRTKDTDATIEPKYEVFAESMAKDTRLEEITD